MSALINEVRVLPEVGSAVTETTLATMEGQLTSSKVKDYELIHSCSPFPCVRCQVLSLLEN